jgi:uncharacterized RDD family membrane protein YckC
MKAQQRVSLISLAIGLLCLSVAGVFAFQRTAIEPGSGYLLTALFLGVFGILQLIQYVVLWGIAQRVPTPPPSAAAAPPPPSLRRAGIAIRMTAWLIDVVLLAAIIFIGAVFIDVVMTALNRGIDVPADAGPALWIAAFVTLPAYLIVAWHMGHTAGMALLRLKVISASTGALPTWSQSVLRFLAALPSMVLGVPVGLLFALAPERLALHDRIAGTAVVSTARQSVALPQLGLPGG